MILGRESHVHAACFDEIDRAVSALTDRVVCFNAHAFPDRIPAGAVVYNLENVPHQIAPEWFDGFEVWDFSRRSVEFAAKGGRAWKHVPVGYHSSMKRFDRCAPREREIDVVFAGAMNARRAAVLEGFSRRGLRVVHVPSALYGAGRDRILARAKLALNMLFYEGGVFPALRVAHLVANGVPVLSERCEEGWDFVETCGYDELIERAEELAREDELDLRADRALRIFEARPMMAPS